MSTMVNSERYGYVRVSTIDQHEENQQEVLKQYDITTWFIEKLSGKDTERPELKEMLKYARRGDQIYIYDLSRLARNTKDLLTIIDNLKERGIELISHKDKIDTTTATGELIITVMGAIATFERKNMLERQKLGIERAKKEGKYKGGRQRIKKPKLFEEVYKEWRDDKITAKVAIEKLKLTKSTFYKLVAELEGRLKNKKVYKRKVVKQ